MKYLSLIFAFLFLVFSCKTSGSKQEHDGHGHKVYYTCSMDPQIMESKPGKCPICHMDLTPVSADRLQSDSLHLSDDQLKLANIQTEKLQTGWIKSNVAATGTVKENQNNIRYVNARFDGRIEKLHVKTNGEIVRKGQVLYKVYSEMLTATQSEFIQNWNLLIQEPESKILKTIHQASVDKLLLWGLTTLQIEGLKKLEKPPIPCAILSPASGVVKSVAVSEGSTVMEGDPVFILSEYQSLWVEAQFYPEEISGIKTGSKVIVQVNGQKEILEGKVEQVLPQVSPSSTVNVVRILIQPKGENVLPGMQANIYWYKEGNKTLIIPLQAVLQEAKGNTVWLRSSNGVFIPKRVQLGAIKGKEAEIISGLKEGDEVVVSGAYLLQSEFEFRKGKKPVIG